MSYRIPATTVQFGTVLDLQVEPNASTRIRVDDWAGWLLCAGENGFELAPGRCKLFLFPAAPRDGAPGTDYRAATTGYERWHKRPAARVDIHDVPAHLGCCQGRVLRIGYRSDKWGRRGAYHDYDHDFCESDGMPPLLYTDTASLAGASAAVLVGGDMVIREDGIS